MPSKVLAMDPTVEFWWVPKCDKDLPENEQFRIKYRHLTAREEASLSDNQISSVTKGKESRYKYSVSSTDLLRCEKTIIGWDNFFFPADHPTKASEPVPFAKENIGLVPPNIRGEFVGFITKRDEAEDEDEAGTSLGEAKQE